MACEVCGKDQGGVYSNGDPYGDAKYVGIETGPSRHWCWDHADQVVSPDDEIDAAFARRGWCGFVEAWVGRCRNPIPCARHKDQRCWKCGKPATKNCGQAGSLVCGVPECKDHPHTH